MLPARRILPLLPAAAATAALAGCAIEDGGPRTAQTRHVAGFTRIENLDSADLRVHVGAPQRVEVRAGRHVIDDVHTVVRGGTLQVTFDHGGFWHKGAEVEISVPRLTGIETSGSGDVDADGLHADALAIRSDGSADVALEGRVRRLTLDMDGSGDADLAGLAARDAHVSVGGSGDADVRAVRRLDVAVDGSGDVRYHGRPALRQRVDGSGDVTRAG